MMQQNTGRMSITAGVAGSVAIAAAQFGVLRLLKPDLGANIGLFMSVAALGCSLLGFFNVGRMGLRALAGYVGGYVALFAFYMIWLGGEDHRALIFTVFAMSWGAVFHFGAPAGYVLIVVVGYFVFPLFGLPVTLMLALFYTLLQQVWLAARRTDNYLLTVFFGVSLLFVLIVFFPLMHFVVQRTPQDIARTLTTEEVSEDDAVAGTLLRADTGRQVREALGRSLLTSTISTVIALVLGLPLAYVLVRGDFPGRSILDVAIDVPILIPPPIVGIALIMLVGGNTVIGSQINAAGQALAEFFGRGTAIGRMFANIRFEGSMLGIIFAQVLVSSSFFVRSAMAAIRGVDARLEYVSRTLGAGPLRTFLFITLPLAAPGIFAGCILAWARAISEFGSIQLIAYRPLTGPTLIFDWHLAKGGTEGPSASVAILMTLMCLGIFCLLHIVASRLLWRKN